MRTARTWRSRSPRGEAAAAAGERQHSRGGRRIWIGRAACPHRLLQLQKAPTAEASLHLTAANTKRSGERGRGGSRHGRPRPRPTTSGAERRARSCRPPEPTKRAMIVKRRGERSARLRFCLVLSFEIRSAVLALCFCLAGGFAVDAIANLGSHVGLETSARLEFWIWIY